jgi:hypothetical protein
MNWCPRCFWSAPWAVDAAGLETSAKHWPDIWPSGELDPLARGEAEDFWGDTPPSSAVELLAVPAADAERPVRFAWPLANVVAVATGLVAAATLGAAVAPGALKFLALVGFGTAALEVIHRAWNSEPTLVEVHDAEVRPAGRQDRVHLVGRGEVAADQGGHAPFRSNAVGERHEGEPAVLRPRGERGLSGQRLDQVAS